MFTPDENRRLWHRGTKIGVIYGLISFVILGVTTSQDPEGSLAWLSRFSSLVILLPIGAASQAYVAGRKDAGKWQSDRHT